MFKMRGKWYRNQHTEEDEDLWRWLLHKGDHEEHVEVVEDASICHNVFNYDFCNVDVYFDQ